MHLEILGDLTDVATIATGSGIREVARLRKRYDRGRWRKRKGNAEVRLISGESVRADVRWYEATGPTRQVRLNHYLVRFRAISGSQEHHIGSHIVEFYNVKDGSA
jgi:hypothetical protein